MEEGKEEAGRSQQFPHGTVNQRYSLNMKKSHFQLVHCSERSAPCAGKTADLKSPDKSQQQLFAMTLSRVDPKMVAARIKGRK